MQRAIRFCVAVFAFVGITHAKTLAPQIDVTRQVVGLFASTCIQFAGNTAGLRDFLKERHLPELNAQAHATFVGDHAGIGFDASNKITHLAVVSEDNGVCSVFASQGTPAQIEPLIESVIRSRGLQISQSGEREVNAGLSHFYAVTVTDHKYKPVISGNSQPGASVQAALTLSP
jgi:hypothetical protein